MHCFLLSQVFNERIIIPGCMQFIKRLASAFMAYDRNCYDENQFSWKLLTLPKFFSLPNFKKIIIYKNYFQNL